jgi:hypothetical protein
MSKVRLDVTRGTQTKLTFVVIDVLALTGCRPPTPSPQAGISGPTAVPEASTYTYDSHCNSDGGAGVNWNVSPPGTLQSGAGESATIVWGDGPAQAVITVQCGQAKPKTLSVDVVQVTVVTKAIVVAANAVTEQPPKNNPHCNQLVTANPPPAVKLGADITVNGPQGNNWHGKIEAGFVQRLLRAAPATWEGAYWDGVKPPNGQTRTLRANFSANPLPFSDCTDDTNCDVRWYDKTAAVAFGASGKKSISTNDSPTPGWWHQDAGCSGNLKLQEAQAIWEFETYVCVRNNTEAPAIFFRRTRVPWRLTVRYDIGPPPRATIEILPNPPPNPLLPPPPVPTWNADVSADPTSCPTGGTSVNHWLNNDVTFQ